MKQPTRSNSDRMRTKRRPAIVTEPRTINASSFPVPLGVPTTATPARKQRAERHGAKRAQRWSAEEDAFLREHYAAAGAAFCARHLNRTKSAVNTHAEALGIRSELLRAWTSKEEATLRLLYPTRTAGELARRLKRSERSVRGKLFCMGLTASQRGSWTAGEIAYIRAHYGATPTATLAEELGRSIDAVEIKAGRLGLARSKTILTEEQRAAIVRSIAVKSYTDIARELNVSVHAVRRVADDAGHRARPTSRRWTEAEDAQLRRLIVEATDVEIAARLNRTALAVVCRAEHLGLGRVRRAARQRFAPKAWTAEDDALLRSLVADHSHRRIAERMERSETAIATRASVLGCLKRPKRGG